ncbi:hypothetical protein GPECTOR_35g822 [Gonium pectorale]|uniref:DUF5745 domain-containing protein n=1 Tax=Gonium pectorale TaxID=33097 RepID=A0A150GC27_GONPE|nr:hypothetical protein GPECTOR_35g822 [Gonium pectorale]|eukprot:KXZ47384.1 hypothetical protein GPECTOR_35g822 [Gonium pectorale]
MDEGFTSEELVQACNRVLVFAGLVARVANAEEVRVVCSSTGLFVAALEAFLQHRLEDITRSPATVAERAYNIGKVVDVLSMILSCDLSHISGARIVEGNLEDISNLLELLAALCQDKPLLDPPKEEKDPHAGASRGAEPAWSRDEAGRGPPAQGPDSEVDEGEGEEEEEEYSFGEPGDSAGDSPGEEEASDRGSSGAEHSSGDEQGPGPSQRRLHGSRPGAREHHGIRVPEPPGRASGARSGRQAAQTQRQPSAKQRNLSPIPEARDSRGADGGQDQGEAGGAASRTGAGGRARPRGQSADGGRARGASGGGASSAISIPSHADDEEAWPGSGFHPEDAAAAPPMQPPDHAQRAWSDAAHRSWRSGASTSTLLERALSHADATLHDLGQEYEDYYYGHDADQDGDQGRSRVRRGASQRIRTRMGAAAGGSSRASGDGGSSRSSAGRKPVLHSLEAASWPDGEHGTNKQQRTFLRRAQRALHGEASGDGSRGRLSSAPSSSTATRSTRSTGAGVPRARKKGAPGTATSGRAQRTRGSQQQGASGRYPDTEAVLQTLYPSVTALPDADRQARKLMQRTATTYSSSLPVSVGGKGVAGLAGSQGLHATGVAKHGMQLNADLEGKLRYVFGLATEHPKQRAARSAVQQLSIHEEHLRHVRRRELVERLGEARARREAAQRLNTNRLQERRQMRRAVQAELALREAFLEVLEGEKEVLLAARREAKAKAEFPQYKSAMRKAEAQYMQLFNTLEKYLASERQQRVRANMEAVEAQRQGNQLAASVVQDRMRETLGRIAQQEEAFLARHSIATRPAAKQALVSQVRQLLGLH